MTRSLGSLVIAIVMLASTSGLAQDDSGGSTSGGATAMPAPAEPVAPNAPLQSTDQGPLPAGDQAGTATASNWLGDPVNLAVGAGVIGAAVCIAICGGGHNSTSSTTTTTPK